jgi:hypothetical protein
MWTDVHDLVFSHRIFGEKSRAEVTIFLAFFGPISCREIAPFHTRCGQSVDSIAVAIQSYASRAMHLEMRARSP